MQLFQFLLLPILLSFALNARALELDSTALLDGSRLVYHTQPAQSDYRLVKGAIKKVNNQWRANDERVVGLLERKTYVLRDTLGFNESLVLLQNHIQMDTDLQQIFACEGLDCGSSSGWANQYLNIKQLYGLDSYQYYVALQSKNPLPKEQLHVFYLVQRGNKRIYLQHDSVLVANQRVRSIPTEEIFAAVKAQNAVQVMSLVDESALTPAQVDELKRLVALLAKEPLWRLRVVGHNYGAATSEMRLQLSLQAAEQLRAQLLELGANPKQVSAHGLGSLAPAQGVHERIELVIEQNQAQ